jgi:hypothetical protein
MDGIFLKVARRNLTPGKKAALQLNGNRMPSLRNGFPRAGARGDERRN